MFLCTEKKGNMKYRHLFTLKAQNFSWLIMKCAIHWWKQKGWIFKLSKSMSVLPACNQQHVGRYVVVPVMAFLYAAMALASVSNFLLITYPSDLQRDSSWQLLWLACWMAAGCQIIYATSGIPFIIIFMSAWLNLNNYCTMVYTPFMCWGSFKW